MTSTQMVSIAIVVVLMLIPQVIALYLSGPRDSKPEHEYDYR